MRHIPAYVYASVDSVYVCVCAYNTAMSICVVSLYICVWVCVCECVCVGENGGNVPLTYPSLV